MIRGASAFGGRSHRYDTSCVSHRFKRCHFDLFELKKCIEEVKWTARSGRLISIVLPQ